MSFWRRRHVWPSPLGVIDLQTCRITLNGKSGHARSGSSVRTCESTVSLTVDGSDRTTAALRLCPVLISDEDITTPEPSEVDDDFITRAGAFGQPPGVTPIIAGFLRVTRLFCILSRILRLLRDMPPDVGTAIQSILARLNDELESLPAELTPNSPYDSPGFEACKANILVTQALARFELQQLATAANTPHKDAITQSVLRLLDM